MKKSGKIFITYKNLIKPAFTGLGSLFLNFLEATSQIIEIWGKSAAIENKLYYKSY